jgi:signal transduction histidine kinase
VSLLPRSLFGRLVLVLLAGLALAQLASLYINASERGQLLYRAGGVQLAQRIADIAKLLDSLAPAERRRIVAVFDAPPLAISLDRPPLAVGEARAESDVRLATFAGMLRFALGEDMPVTVIRPAGAPSPDRFAPPPGRFGPPGRFAQPGEAMMPHPMMRPGPREFAPGAAFFVVQVVLRDGTRATFDSHLSPQDASIPLRLALTLAVLLVTVIVLSLIAVRWLTGPLSALANAAEELGRDIDRPPLRETGPLEVRRAAKAFNTMQRRLSRFIADRTRILTAMSHDLKTPITRLRLRSEMLDDETLRGKIARDLDEMEAMVTQTLDYMRHASSREALQPVDLNALLESLQSDYRDTGGTVEIEGTAAQPAVQPIAGRPLALRRCLANLIDNAIRYGKRALIKVEDSAAGVTIRVLDEGPGIRDDELEQAFEPFYRGEASRSRETGGTGLGLGIARNIARAHGGELVVRNRPSGGLEAILTLPRGESRSG